MVRPRTRFRSLRPTDEYPTIAAQTVVSTKMEGEPGMSSDTADPPKLIQVSCAHILPLRLRPHHDEKTPGPVDGCLVMVLSREPFKLESGCEYHRLVPISAPSLVLCLHRHARVAVLNKSYALLFCLSLEYS